MAVSHANCTHPRTPAGRRACRAGVRQSDDRVEQYAKTHHLGKKATDDFKTIMRAEKPARIQPRRSGARVSSTGSTCVQAALHVDAHGGRCACGWVAA